MTKMMLRASIGCGVCVYLFSSAAGGQLPTREFTKALALEDVAQTSANVSAGDLDADGDLDLVLAKGRHWPLGDRVLLNDGKGGFTASDLGPVADRTYSAVLADFDGDGDLDVATSNDAPDSKLVFLNDGTAGFNRPVPGLRRDGRRGTPRQPISTATAGRISSPRIGQGPVTCA